MKARWLISFLCMIAFSVHAQENLPADSLIKRLPMARDTERVQLLITLCRRYAHTDIPKSIAYGKEALKQARALHYISGTASALDKLAEGYLRSGNLERSLELQLELLDLYTRMHDLSGRAMALQATGVIYERLGSYPEALHYYFQALRIHERLGEAGRSAVTMSSIAHVYLKQGSNATALRYYLQALQLLERQKKKNYSDMAMTATDIGFFYKDQDQLEEALAYFQKALSYAGKIPSKYNRHAITMALTNIGAVYETKQDYKQALAYNREAFDVALKTNNRTLIGLNYENRARIYKNMSSLKESNDYYERAADIFGALGRKDRLAMIQNALAENYLRMNEPDKAALYASRSLATANQAALPGPAEKALKNLVRIHSQAGRYAQALKFQQRYQAIRDTLLNKEKTESISKLQILYETGKKQEQIRLLQNKAEKERIIRFALTGGILLVVVIGLLLYNQERIRHRKNKQLYLSQQALAAEQLRNIRLHETQLQQDLTIKNKELTTYALNFIQKNQLMEELKAKIREIREDTDGEVPSRLNKLQKMIGHSFNLDKDWDDFRLYFEQVHDLFFRELQMRFPGMSNKELRLCALLKLNLSSKEISTILGISPASVKMARYRLRKKMGLNAEADLVAFMIQLEKSASEEV